MFSKKHQEMYVLTPGVFVSACNPIDVKGQAYSILYPIEIILRAGKSGDVRLIIYFEMQD